MDDRRLTRYARWTRLTAALLVMSSGAAVADKRCVVDKPVVVRATTAKAPSCHRAPAAIEKSIAAEITTAYLLEHEGGRADVKFGCDGLGARIREIVVERGSGHGGTLELWRAKRRGDGKYDVRGIVYRGHALMRTAANPPHEQASGVVALPDLDRARAATSAKVREVVPPTPPGMMRGGSSSFSSRDFHVVVRFVDDDGRILERTYTGYASSSHQNEYLGLELAADALSPITSLAPKAGAPDVDDRALFVDRFNAAVPRFDDDFYWWVMERYVDLARYFGTRSTIAGLVTRLIVTKPDRSKIDAREAAVDALARITGWDARQGGRSIEDAAAGYLAECK